MTTNIQHIIGLKHDERHADMRLNGQDKPFTIRQPHYFNETGRVAQVESCSG